MNASNVGGIPIKRKNTFQFGDPSNSSRQGGGNVSSAFGDIGLMKQ